MCIPSVTDRDLMQSTVWGLQHATTRHPDCCYYFMEINDMIKIVYALCLPELPTDHSSKDLPPCTWVSHHECTWVTQLYSSHQNGLCLYPYSLNLIVMMANPCCPHSIGQLTMSEVQMCWDLKRWSSIHEKGHNAKSFMKPHHLKDKVFWSTILVPQWKVIWRIISKHAPLAKNKKTPGRARLYWYHYKSIPKKPWKHDPTPTFTSFQIPQSLS